MFERFTDRARRVLVLAQEFARLDGTPYLGAEHILLGVVREGEGVGARVMRRFDVSEEAILATVAAQRIRRPDDATALASIGIDLDAIRSKVEESFGPGALERTKAARRAGRRDAPPFTPKAKKVLELSLREALQLGHNYIGTEHLLLALVRSDSEAFLILEELGLTHEQVRAAVREELAAPH